VPPAQKHPFLGGELRHTWTAADLARSLADLARRSVRSSTDKEPTVSAPGQPGAISLYCPAQPMGPHSAPRTGMEFELPDQPLISLLGHIEARGLLATLERDLGGRRAIRGRADHGLSRRRSGKDLEGRSTTDSAPG
jgi:hypothetical protein